MKFKLIMALVDDAHTENILTSARKAGATGCTVITSARGEGLKPEKTFLGLDLAVQRDLLLFLVAEPLSRDILETIADTGKFDEQPGSGLRARPKVSASVAVKAVGNSELTPNQVVTIRNLVAGAVLSSPAVKAPGKKTARLQVEIFEAMAQCCRHGRKKLRCRF